MSDRLPRYPLLLLGAMTAFTVAGPFGIGYALRGGPSPVWPPDRSVEWAVLLGVSGMVLGLMIACLSLARVANQKIVRGPSPEEDRP